MSTHRLDPLMKPRSIAYIGASETPGSPGHALIYQVKRYGYDGAIYPVNPKYESIQGVDCFASIGDIPEPVDLAILAISSQRVEQQLEQAIAAGARSAVIFDTCYVPDDPDRTLLKRLRDMARAADMPVCGGNGMGIINAAEGVHSTFDNVLDHHRPGGQAAFITHSGSVFAEFGLHHPRVRFNIVVSAGQEIGATMDEYLDYALGIDGMRAVCLFVETVRKPQAFIAALEKADAMGVAIIACKVGRSEKAAAFAQTHSGALVGNDSAYQAVFDRYGVVRVHSLDEMANTVSLFTADRQVTTGGLSMVIDSGGERELVVDIADDIGVPFAEISDDTKAKIAERLFFALEPANPLDAWGNGGEEWDDEVAHYLTALSEDPDTGLTALSGEFANHHTLEDEYGASLLAAYESSDKPMILLPNIAGADYEGMARALTDRGIPVLDSTVHAMNAIKHAFAYRDRLARPAPLPVPTCDPETVERWRERLATGEDLDEAAGYDLLRDFSVAAPNYRIAEDEASAVAGAETLGYPVVLKTAMPGIAHKSDVGGVKLDIQDSAALADVYRDMSKRLGGRVLVTPMIKSDGVEVVMGMVRDSNFGPIVMLGAGGVFVEIMKDVRVILPPFGVDVAEREIDRLKIRPLLDGARGRPAVDIKALAETLSHFSALVFALGDSIREIDVNPLIVGPEGCVAVDALVVRG